MVVVVAMRWCGGAVVRPGSQVMSDAMVVVVVVVVVVGGGGVGGGYVSFVVVVGAGGGWEGARPGKVVEPCPGPARWTWCMDGGRGDDGRGPLIAVTKRM